MKYLWLAVPFLLVGCSSIKYVTMDHGHILTQDHKPVNIVGNPPMICHYAKSPERTLSGYFMYQDNDMIVLDDFGRGTIYLRNHPICKLGLDDNESN